MNGEGKGHTFESCRVRQFSGYRCPYAAAQVAEIAGSIRTFGFTNPLIAVPPFGA
jgi:ParB-like chromosome segregation protein Spo0J